MTMRFSTWGIFLALLVAAWCCAATALGQQPAPSSGAGAVDGRAPTAPGGEPAAGKDSPAKAAAGPRSQLAIQYGIDLDKIKEHDLDRGPGGYLSLVKIFLCIVVFLIWVRTTDWVSRDCQRNGMPYGFWVPVIFFPFMAGMFLCALTIPIFFIGYLLLLASYAGPMAGYVVIRNKRVDDHEKVMTADHLRHVFAKKAQKVGVQIEEEKKSVFDEGAPVVFTAVGGENPTVDRANTMKARHSPGFIHAKEQMADAIFRHAERIVLDFTREAVTQKYQIDGVLHELPVRDRASGDAVLATYKILAAVNPEERRAKQQGQFHAEFRGEHRLCQFASVGTQTGERAVIELKQEGIQFESLPELGIREAMLVRFKEILSGDHGMVLLSTLPGGGLSTLTNLALKSTDRLMREFYEIADRNQDEAEIDGIELVEYDAAAGQTPVDVADKILRLEPDALVVRDLVDGPTVDMLSRQAQDSQLVVSTVRAKDAVEALVRVLLLKADPESFARAMRAVLYMRLLRRLCDACKQAYAPPADLLKKLGIPAGRVKAFYRPYQPPPPSPDNDEEPQICTACGGIGYRGRIGVFELLEVDDKLRSALVQQPKVDLLRKVARQGGHRSLQEEGIVLVARGVTSLAELTRVLK